MCNCESNWLSISVSYGSSFHSKFKHKLYVEAKPFLWLRLSRCEYDINEVIGPLLIYLYTLTLTEHQFLPSSQGCFEDIFIGKGGRTKGEYKYACVDVELKCLCFCYSISLLSSHKYEWNRLNDCRNETSFRFCKDEKVRMLQVKITPSFWNGLESLLFLRLSKFPLSSSRNSKPRVSPTF